MSVNGVTQTTTASDMYSTYQTGSQKSTKTENSSAKENNGVVYEPSKEAPAPAKTYKPNMEMIQKMKADAEARTSQMRTLVEQLMTKQGSAIGKTDSIWSFLAGGNFTVDAATKEQAMADIAEDGYWGVNKTSDRIIDFATALTGGNPDKIEEMRAAFEKGFKEATKTWGGKLPEISQKTYDAVMSKFDKLAQDAATIKDPAMI